MVPDDLLGHLKQNRPNKITEAEAFVSQYVCSLWNNELLSGAKQ